MLCLFHNIKLSYAWILVLNFYLKKHDIRVPVLFQNDIILLLSFLIFSLIRWFSAWTNEFQCISFFIKYLIYNMNLVRGRTTQSQIVTLRRSIEGIKDENLSAIIIYIDYKKTFDTIHRSKFIKILWAYGIPWNPVGTKEVNVYGLKSKSISRWWNWIVRHPCTTSLYYRVTLSQHTSLSYL